MKNGVLRDIIVKGWNSLTNVKKSSTLDVVRVVDMFLVFEATFLTESYGKVSVTLTEVNKKYDL